ncbi:MAG: nucleotidyltransferase substrate binding protein [Bdellovibrionota bacterium]
MAKLELEPLEKAIGRLEQSFERAARDPNDEVVRDGVIQRFEYTMDLCWKFMQRYLKAIAEVDEATLRTKRDIFRESARMKLIADAEAWINHWDARNDTSHDYNEEKAKAVFEQARKFFPDAKAFLKALREAVA